MRQLFGNRVLTKLGVLLVECALPLFGWLRMLGDWMVDHRTAVTGARTSSAKLRPQSPFPRLSIVSLSPKLQYYYGKP